MTKIEALEKTIFNLENDVYEYDWGSSKSCNCGILARTVLNGRHIVECGFFDAEQVNGELSAFSKYAYCMTSNLPLPKVFQTLKNVGFTFEDINDLENLSNPTIAIKLGFEMFDSPYSFRGKITHEKHFAHKPSVILYLKEWVKMLKEEQGAVIPQPTIT